MTDGGCLGATICHEPPQLHSFASRPWQSLPLSPSQVVGFFQAAVDADLRDKLESQRTVEDVMGVIRGRLDGPLPPELALRHEVAELTFSYEEEASPEDFFVPYVWSVVVETSSHLPAPRDRIQIFSPAAAGDGGKGDEGGTDEGVDSAA